MKRHFFLASEYPYRDQPELRPFLEQNVRLPRHATDRAPLEHAYYNLYGGEYAPRSLTTRQLYLRTADEYTLAADFPRTVCMQCGASSSAQPGCAEDEGQLARLGLSVLNAPSVPEKLRTYKLETYKHDVNRPVRVHSAPILPNRVNVETCSVVLHALFGLPGTTLEEYIRGTKTYKTKENREGYGQQLYRALMEDIVHLQDRPNLRCHDLSDYNDIFDTATYPRAYTYVRDMIDNLINFFGLTTERLRTHRLSFQQDATGIMTWAREYDFYSGPGIRRTPLYEVEREVSGFVLYSVITFDEGRIFMSHVREPLVVEWWAPPPPKQDEPPSFWQLDYWKRLIVSRPEPAPLAPQYAAWQPPLSALEEQNVAYAFYMKREKWEELIDAGLGFLARDKFDVNQLNFPQMSARQVMALVGTPALVWDDERINVIIAKALRSGNFALVRDLGALGVLGDPNPFSDL